MNLGSIRLRLAVWYLGVLLMALSLFGTGIWLGLRHELLQTLDDGLAARTAGLAQFLERESSGSDLPAIREEAREYASGLPEGSRMRLFGPDGSLLFASPGAREADVSMRFRSQDITVRGFPLKVEFAAPLRYVNETLDLLRDVLFTSIPILVLAAGLGGWWLSRKALRPVDRMTVAAETLSLDDLSARLIVPRTGDELERLGDAWNRMLDRISASVRRMKQFTTDAAHELRTPIAVIRATAELGLRRERDTTAYRSALAGIAEETHRLSDLVDDLMWLARNDASKLHYSVEDVPIAGLAGGVCDLLQPLAEAAQVTMRDQIEVGEDQTVRADSAALRRLILILADNAIKFSPPESTVTLRVSAVGTLCRIEVQDSGPGIDPEDLPFIFDRFYRGDHARTSSGSGLGLAIAKAIAEAHGATLQAQSGPGIGSCFQMDLPFGEPQPCDDRHTDITANVGPV